MRNKRPSDDGRRLLLTFSPTMSVGLTGQTTAELAGPLVTRRKVGGLRRLVDRKKGIAIRYSCFHTLVPKALLPMTAY